MQVQRETKDAKSRAGRRPLPLQDELIKLFRKQQEEQGQEWSLAGQLWEKKGYRFTLPRLVGR
ncbi:hypothetical protein [Saccharothrix sp. ST-888]|uniref:hypothetical protein n=1 Tax=Saccharothrix sp. ST-888 TaxID=1427391 RepID=UPI0012DFFB49|nr:hypothetical protein [Saccharothrix sp. ST-888]